MNLEDIANAADHSWTADIRLQNGQEITIWYTCWPMIKSITDKMLSISTDIPKFKIIK